MVALIPVMFLFLFSSGQYHVLSQDRSIPSGTGFGVNLILNCSFFPLGYQKAMLGLGFLIFLSKDLLVIISSLS